ncbi:hypothetical protein SAMN04515671_1314 [Nakamurella panacisegetis]|uniref:Peptidase MA superfamily protein n=1 Tax=Nakamurella panacisegetis TaxID=1090615 RepID=A0A1H0KHV5_9ACTN|nr:hypothetical protein [Nakamurella panacisegetis]SDO55507.1 hypothetical protein SAMN04515671_1314 [Nakamurella panacisegetis]
MKRRQHTFVVVAVLFGFGLTSCTGSSTAPGSSSATSAPPSTSIAVTSTSSQPPLSEAPVGSPSAPSSAEPTPTPASSSAPLTLQSTHDRLFQPLLATLARDLQGGRAPAFLASFAPALRTRVGQWFANATTLGVAAAQFVPADDYSSGATDAAGTFSRTVVLGIRTPYDDAGTLPGIPYRIDVAVSTSKGRSVLTVTGWKPAFLADPLDCGCKLGVVHSATVAVVFAAADPDLAFWSASALRAASDAVTWADQQLAGSGLTPPHGQVIFLADRPFRWFLGANAPPQESNVTVPLSDALGPGQGGSHATQSRIVVMLLGSDHVVVPNDEQGREYVSDVAAHESTHQLMNRNSQLAYRTDDSPPTWGAEGVAVAVEVLHRQALGDAGDIGYPEPYDPADIDPAWLRAHLSDAMPTRSQIYSSSATDSAGYYALSGSVFLYLNQAYGYRTMMQVGAALYAKANQNPFALFPDPSHLGGHLPVAQATANWRAWFTGRYLG